MRQGKGGEEGGREGKGRWDGGADLMSIHGVSVIVHFALGFALVRSLIFVSLSPEVVCKRDKRKCLVFLR